MRVADRPVPTVGGHRPDVERWPAALFVGIEKQPTSSYVYDDYSAHYDDPGARYHYDDQQAWPHDRYDLWCQTHGLQITTGATDPDTGIEAGHVALTLDNRDGSLSQYDAAGRLVDYFPGRALDVWAVLEDTPGTVGATINLPNTAGAYLALPAETALNIVGDLELVVRVAQMVPAEQIVHAVACKHGTNTDRSWQFSYYNSRYRLNWCVGPANTSWYSFQPNATQAIDTLKWIRCRRRAADGIVSMEWAADAPDEPTSWTHFPGSPSAAGAFPAGPLYNATARVQIGGVNYGAITPAGARVPRVIVRNTFGGPALLDVDERLIPDDTVSTFKAASGQTVTVHGDVLDPVSSGPVSSSWWLFSGEITAWRERADGTIDAEAFDAFSGLNVDIGTWDPGHYADTVPARLGKILTAADWHGPTRFDRGHVELHSYLTTATPLEEIRAVARSDGGVIGVDADGTLVYRDRLWWVGRTDQAAVPVLSDNVCDAPVIVWDPDLTTDDDLIANVAVLRNVAGVEVTATNVPSVDRYGRQTVPDRDDDQWIGEAAGADLAAYLVARRGGGYLRLEGFSLYLHDRRYDLWRTGIDLRIGDVVTFLHEQPAVSGVQLLNLTLIVSQIVHDITPDSWVVTVATTGAVGSTTVHRYDRTAYRYDEAGATYVL